MFKFMTLALAAFGLTQTRNCGCDCDCLPGGGLGGLGGLGGSLPGGIGAGLPGLNINKLKSDILNNALNNQGSLNLDFSGVPALSGGNIDFSGLPPISGGNLGGYGTQYVIRSSYGKVLDISQTKPTDAIIYGFHGGPNQRFTITRDGVNSVIRCVQDNGVVESNTQGDVDTAAFNNTPNEKWTIKKVDNAQNPNLFMIINAADGKCLDLKESRNENDNDVINYPCHGLPNQLWEIIPITPGTTVIPTSYAPYCA